MDIGTLSWSRVLHIFTIHSFLNREIATREIVVENHLQRHIIQSLWELSIISGDSIILLEENLSFNIIVRRKFVNGILIVLIFDTLY